LLFERGVGFKDSLRDFLHELNLTRAGLGFTAFLFAITGPLVVILATANQAKLAFSVTTSWIFIIYFTAGFATLLLALYYRQPIVMAWSIPGVLIVADTMTRTAYTNILGAYLVVGILLVVFGATGAVKWATRRIPLPVLLGMVAAILLPYGVAVFRAMGSIPQVAYPAVGLFLLLAALPRLTKIFPPILTTVVLVLVLASAFNLANWQDLRAEIVQPLLLAPTFDLAVILELTLPLLVAVVGIQNGQGIGILLSQGYTPPINTMTTACGLASLVNLWFGGHSACISGPSMAIAGSPEGGEPKGRFAGVVTKAFMWMGFAIFAPVAASLDKVLLAPALIPLLGGLALLPVLVNTFGQAFSGKFRNGALFAFLITLSDLKLLGIGSAFWGLVGGMLAVIALDRTDFRQMLKEK
jgi:benzoate membrane transport protein